MKEDHPLRTLIEYIIALLDLFEAEGRRFRRNVAGLVIGLVLILAGGLLALGGVGLCIFGVYAGFLHAFCGSVFWAGLVTGAITLFCAMGMLWIGKHVMRG
jgi:hypothetical protein